MLYASQTPTLAPLYDLLCTAVYPQLTEKMAMKLGCKYRFEELQDRHWKRFAEAAGLSWAQTRKRVLAMASQLPTIAQRLQTDGGYPDVELIQRITGLIEQRCELTLRRLIHT